MYFFAHDCIFPNFFHATKSLIIQYVFFTGGNFIGIKYQNPGPTIAFTLLQRLLAVAVTMRPLEGRQPPSCYVHTSSSPVTAASSTHSLIVCYLQVIFIKIDALFCQLKFIYSEKATKFCEIFPLLLSAVHTVKSKGKISQNFVTFSEYMNFHIRNV